MKLRKTSFLNRKVNSIQLATFFSLTNIYLLVHIWMMYHFSKAFIHFMFTSSADMSNTYTEFFHSSLNISQMNDMDASFMTIMFLLHFNPVNIILKYTIIKL